MSVADLTYGRFDLPLHTKIKVLLITIIMRLTAPAVLNNYQ